MSVIVKGDKQDCDVDTQLMRSVMHRADVLAAKCTQPRYKRSYWKRCAGRPAVITAADISIILFDAFLVLRPVLLSVTFAQEMDHPERPSCMDNIPYSPAPRPPIEYCHHRRYHDPHHHQHTLYIDDYDRKDHRLRDRYAIEDQSQPTSATSSVSHPHERAGSADRQRCCEASLISTTIYHL